ncbi:carboxypeptidase-like regulatory domain-containing protein [uncultured Flavobacterium sp.]|uniref:carboxypeptidase-like regulatory domain-containing protein n=1 Tax=uncultured Flavobacterium sp. TaxID=165435 RepID=UPI0025DFDB75|nr:carboxypeptidase-like regulatory domain-containing protein [uncultured Flavobacterium sp.]
MTKQKPTKEWLSSETWKITKLTSGALLALTLQTSFAAESKEIKFSTKLGCDLTLTKNENASLFVDKLVKGKVTGPQGEPLPGVNILVKGTKITATTDFDGNFTIEVPDSNSILVFSYTGFLTKEVPADQAANIKLEEQNQTLNEVVVELNLR